MGWEGGMAKKGKDSELQILSPYCGISFCPFLYDNLMSDFPTPGT